MEENTSKKNIKLCEFCKNPFNSIPSRPKQRFCCKVCVDSYKAAPIVKCSNCSKEKKTDPFKLKRNKNFFCSEPCRKEFHGKHYYTNKTCMNCKKEFLVKNCEIKRHKTDNYYCSVKCAEEFGFRNGELNWNWKGGRTKHMDGYIWVLDHNHPNSDKLGHVLEHVKVMSEHLGRPLKKGEEVHHINEITNDNRIENLELMTRSEHIKHHMDDLIKNRGYSKSDQG